MSRNLEFQTTKTLNELIKEGIIHKDFAKLGDIQLDRKLYSHQEKAIRLINQKHNLIITTGTASGKTESFLYPIINEILHEKNINVPGIRAIFLFPINALVNDQFDRVRKILCKYPNIKYAYFTGDTEEKIKDLNSERQKIRNATGIDISTNELMDRESIRNNPPHILFTNYSMLEYMLLRPIDSTLFTKENIGKLKFIVLDEAHTYKGALGIEIGMLMRRLLQRIGKDDVQFILASATLGEKEGIEKIQEFGYNLTSKTYNKEDILFADKVQLNSNNAKYTVDPTDYEEIYNSNYDSNTLKQILNKYHINQNDDQQAALYDLVIQDPNLYKVNSILSKKSIIIKDLLEEMKKHGFTIESLSAFIDIICKCKKANLKIMDIKYHTFIRSASGAFITLDENSKISLNQREYIDDKKAFEIGNCNKCKSVYIIGIHKDNTIYQNNSIDIYENYNEQDKTIVDYFILEDEIDTDKDYGDKLTKYLLCPKCAKTIKADATDTSRICEDRDTKKVVVYKVNKEKSEVQNNLTECPICEQRNPYGMISTVGIGKDLATAIIAQIFFESISKEQKNDDKKYVKQILSFSDSRQQAAFSAKSCQNDHYKLLRKKLLFKILENRQEMSFDDAEAKLDAKIEEKKLFEEDETKQAKITLLKDILYIDKIPSGEEVGLYYFEYEPINKLISTLQDDDLIDLLHDLQINCKITLEEFKVYLKFIINELKNKVCIYYDGLAREDKDKYLSYKKFNKYVTYTKQNEYSGKIKDKV
ncbi:DEAD/DEAH box helicase [bacterium]|nr:DEAD/DEAH box helicase [bacterium]MBO6095129.1 DEAD/DEAH box helicase [bacterium]